MGDDLEPIWNSRVYFSDDGSIVEIAELSSEIECRDVLIPGIFNAHVHSADIGLRGVRGKSLDELVGANSIKSKYLSRLSSVQLDTAVRRSYEEARNFRISGWSDFREGGIEGLRPYETLPLTFLAFGRPDVSDFHNLGEFDHFGIRDVAYYTEEELNQLREYAELGAKLTFIHASEDKDLRDRWQSKYGMSDVIWAVEEIRPRAIVHLTHSGIDDFRVMKDRDTGAIFCLGSNQFTKVGVPDIPLAIEMGLAIGVGTDNAMFFPLSVGDELRRIQTVFPEIDSKTLIYMATVGGASLANLDFSIRRRSSHYTELSLGKIGGETELFNEIVTKFP